MNMSKADEYLAEMVRKRGYVSRVHTLLAKNDLDVLIAYDPVPTSVYVVQRALSAELKELGLVVGMAAVRMPAYAIQSHMRKSASLGIAPDTIGEAIDLVEADAGRPAHDHARAAWLQLFDQAPFRNPAPLDRHTREMLRVVTLACLKAPPGRIAAQMREAIDAGATDVQLLELLELLLPHGGVLTFEHGKAVLDQVLPDDPTR
ncbi:hypothetical protein BH09PSE5_BH09PSE5_03790 [soil metagenome]